MKLKAGRLLPTTKANNGQVDMNSQVSWDHDKIKAMLKDKVCRQTFLDKIETEIKTKDIVGKAVLKITPDESWKLLASIVKEVATSHFTAELRGPNHGRYKERLAILREI